MPSVRATYRPRPRRNGPAASALVLGLTGLGFHLAVEKTGPPVPEVESVPVLPSGGPGGLADLVLGRDAIHRGADGDSLTVEVENRGTLPSGPTSLVATDRAPAVITPADGSPLFPRHRLLREERGLVIWPERHPDRFLLRVRWQGVRESGRCAGQVAILGEDRRPLVPAERVAVGRLTASELASVTAGGLRWDAASGREASGFDLVYRPAAAPALLVLERLHLDGVPGLNEVFLGNWWLSRFQPVAAAGGGDDGEDESLGRVEVRLSDPRLAHVSLPAASDWRRVAPLPSLVPGATATVTLAAPPPGSPIFIELDPDDRVPERFEGNNVAHLDPPGSPIMVSLHTHASLSEGNASLDTQMDLLSRVGYDAVFWTEHDWLVTGHGLARLWSFEDGPTPRSWWFEPQRLDPGAMARIAPDPEGARAGRHGLRLRLESRRRPHPGSSGPAREAAFTLRVWRSANPRALAQGLTVSFDLRPAPGSAADGEFLVEFDLSDQPRARRRLTYRLRTGTPNGPPVLTLPPPGTAPPPALAPGHWTRIVVPLTEHARALFGEREDNSLTATHFGAAVRDDPAVWDLDDLRLDLATTGAPVLDWQREKTAHYPAIASHVTSEISWYVPHFNAFLETPILPDYSSLPQQTVAVEVERRTHAAGGALSLNHPLGFNAPFPSSLVDSQIEYRLYNADLVEIGYRHRAGADFPTHLAFWNRALDHGLVASAVGVTDTHGAGRGGGFARDENNFATWIEADPWSTPALVEALLAGRTTFGDPLLLGTGRLDLKVDERHRPGAVLIGEPRPHVARGNASRLPAGARLDLVADGRTIATARVGEQSIATVDAQLPAATRWVRLEAWDARGEPIASTNAAAFRRDLPAEGLALSRLHHEAGPIHLSGTGRFHVQELSADRERLVLRGARGNGRLRLEGSLPDRLQGRALDDSAAGSGGRVRIERQSEGVHLVSVAPPGVVLGPGTRPAWPWFAALLVLFACGALLLVARRRMRRGGLAVVLLPLLLPSACARYCPEPRRPPDAPEAVAPRPCGPIEACVLPFWLGTTGIAHAATVAFPLGDAPSRHTGWSPGEVQRWQDLAQATNQLIRKDAAFVRQLAEAESIVRGRFEAEALRLGRRCRVPPGERELRRLGQRITEQVYARAGIYHRLRALNPGATAATSDP